MKKQSITISVPNNTTRDEIKEMRQLFSEQYGAEYKLNILISGNQDMKTVLKNIIVTKFDLTQKYFYCCDIIKRNNNDKGVQEQ